MGDPVDNMCGWQCLPAGVLQVIGSQLPWSDMLCSRLVCAHWRAAIATVITQLRVHVAPGCSNTAVNHQFESQPCKQVPEDGEVQNPNSLQNRSAVVPTMQQSAGGVLFAGLQQLPCVTAVQLVLTEHTTASNLENMLRVAGQHANIHELTIWEADPIYQPLQARSYAASLQLRKLPHVHHLTIRSTVTWGLQDIWQQVADMVGSSSGSGSSGGAVLKDAKRGTTYPAGSSSDYIMGGSGGSRAAVLQPFSENSSSSSAPAGQPFSNSTGSSSLILTHQAAGMLVSSNSNEAVGQPVTNSSSSSSTSLNQYQGATTPAAHLALETLTIMTVPLLSQGQVCSIPTDVIFPPNLKQLTTPLPGQKDRHGVIVCTLGHSHEQYMKHLARALPQLESLKVAGSYEGDTGPFQSMVGLTELQLRVGGMLRSMQHLDIDSSSSSSSDTGLAKLLLDLPRLQKLALATSDGGVVPIKLDWLQGAKQLRHLAASIDPAVPEPGAARTDQLQSMTWRLLNTPVAHAAVLLDHIVAAGRQMTKLCISRGDPNSITIRRLSRIPRPSLSLQCYHPAFTSLISLSLVSGPERMLFTIQDPAVIWQELPLLRELRLQGVGLGYSTDGALPPHKMVLAMAEHSDMSLPLGFDGTSGVMQPSSSADPTNSALQQKIDEYLTLWLEDLPPNLLKLGLSRYVIVLGNQQQQQQQQEKSGQAISSGGGISSTSGGGSSSSSSSGERSSSSSTDCVCSAFGCLEHLSLAACCVVQLVQDSPTQLPQPVLATQHQPVAMLVNGRVESIPSDVVSPFVHLTSALSLLQHATGSSKLKELQLIQVPLLRGDVGFIAAHLGSNMQLLQLQPADWLAQRSGNRLSTGAVSSSRQLPDAAETSQGMLVQHAVAHVAALAAAAVTGALRQLQSLSLDFTSMLSRDSSTSATGAGWGWSCDCGAAVRGLGVELCRVACGFSGLRRLKLALDLQHCAVTLAGSSSSAQGYEVLPLAEPDSSSIASTYNTVLQLQQQHQHIRCASRSCLCCCRGPWQLSNMTHLCVLDVTLCVPPIRVMGDLGPGVLGRCKQCGGGVGLEAVRWFFKHAVPLELPTCEILYEEAGSAGGW